MIGNSPRHHTTPQTAHLPVAWPWPWPMSNKLGALSHSVAPQLIPWLYRRNADILPTSDLLWLARTVPVQPSQSLAQPQPPLLILSLPLPLAPLSPSNPPPNTAPCVPPSAPPSERRVPLPDETPRPSPRPRSTTPTSRRRSRARRRRTSRARLLSGEWRGRSVTGWGALSDVSDPRAGWPGCIGRLEISQAIPFWRTASGKEAGELQPHNPDARWPCPTVLDDACLRAHGNHSCCRCVVLNPPQSTCASTQLKPTVLL